MCMQNGIGLGAGVMHPYPTAAATLAVRGAFGSRPI